MKYLYLLLLTLLYISASSCSKNIKFQHPYTLEEFELNGKVKTYSIIKYSNLYSEKEYKRYHFSLDGILRYYEIKYHKEEDYYKKKYIYISDKNDKVKKIIIKNMNDDIFEIIYFKYNNEGLIKWKNITCFDFFGDSFSYDQDITKIKYKSGFKTYEAYCKYDIFFNFFHSTFDIEKDITKLKYRSDDLLILQCMGYSKSNIIGEYVSEKYSQFRKYVYHDDKITHEYVYDKDNIIYIKYDYFNDSKGNIIKILKYKLTNKDNTNDFILSRTETFEYDNKNNKTYKIIIDHCNNGLDKKSEEIFYTYEYY